MADPLTIQTRNGGLPAAILLTVCVAGLFLFVFSLPPFHLGLSVQTELPAIVLHIIGGLVLAVFACLVFINDSRALAAIRDPLFLLVSGFSLWTAATGMLAGRFAISLTGPLSQGVGALAVFEAGLVYLAVQYIRQSGALLRSLLAAAALMAFILVLLLDLTGRHDRGLAPYYFGDYLGFVAFGFCAILPVTSPFNRKLTVVLTVLLAIAAIIQSGNKAALMGFGLMVVWGVILQRSFIRTELSAVGAPLLLAVSMPFLIYAVGSQYQPEDIDRLLRSFDHAVVPAAILSLWASLWSRAMLVKVSFADLLEQGTWLTGSGWGTFGDALIRQLRIVDTRHHEWVGDTLTYWDAIQRTDFHSHNLFTETLLAGGVPAVLLALAVLWQAARRMKGQHNGLCRAWLAGVVLTVSFWFQLPLTIIWLAMALAVLVCPYASDTPVLSRARRMLIAGALVTASVGLALVSATSFRDARTVKTMLDPPKAVAGTISNCGTGSLTFWHRDEYLSRLLSVYADRVVSTSGDDRESYLTVLGYLYCLAVRRLDEDNQSPRLVVTVVNASGLLRYSPTDAGGANVTGETIAGWSSWVDRLLYVAPQRTDLLVPYFNHLLLLGNEERLYSIVSNSLYRFPDDPVALWFRGIVRLGREGEADDGLEDLKRSVANGIADIMPIPDALRMELGLS